MKSDALDLIVLRLHDRVRHADLLSRAFGEWLGVFDLGAAEVGSPGLWSPRDVAISGLRESLGRRAARPFADGLHWLRSREYFRPHVPPVFEADPLAILAVALAIKSGSSDGAVAWIQDIAIRAAQAESDPWRLSLLAAAAGRAPEANDLAVALGLASEQSIHAAAREASLILEDVSPERAAVRLAVLTRAPRPFHDSLPPADSTHQQGTINTHFLAANPTTTNSRSRHEGMRSVQAVEEGGGMIRQNGQQIIALHGIRTRGGWQKSLATPLSKSGLIPVLLDYGYFLALQLLIPWFRRRKIEWFRGEYMSQVGEGDPAPHLVAHSFGTYIAAEAMRKYPEIRFSRVILCGSIIQREFPWTIAFQRGQVQAVLNESGGRDLPATFVGNVVSDAGASGVKGFIESHSCLFENHNTHFAHSDVFYLTRATQSWIPFLCRGTFVPITQMPAPAQNLAFRRMVVLVVALTASALLYFWAQQANDDDSPGAAKTTSGEIDAPDVSPDLVIRSQLAHVSVRPQAYISIPLRIALPDSFAGRNFDSGILSTLLLSEGKKMLSAENCSINIDADFSKVEPAFPKRVGELVPYRWRTMICWLNGEFSPLAQAGPYEMIPPRPSLTVAYRGDHFLIEIRAHLRSTVSALDVYAGMPIDGSTVVVLDTTISSKYLPEAAQTIREEWRKVLGDGVLWLLIDEKANLCATINLKLKEEILVSGERKIVASWKRVGDSSIKTCPENGFSGEQRAMTSTLSSG